MRAQPFAIFNGTASAGAGAFLNTDGKGASGCSNNEDYTCTICPGSPVGAISLNFLTFNMSTAGATPIDLMTIHDGRSTAASPSFSIPGGLGGTYLVCLTAYEANGCPDTHCEPIEVLDALVVWVPNAMTPNGDGENDRVMPVVDLPHLVKDLEFMIFDRWGLLLSQREKVHEPWGGIYRGEIVQEVAHMWKTKCKNRRTNELIERTGYVTLLK